VKRSTRREAVSPHDPGDGRFTLFLFVALRPGRCAARKAKSRETSRSPERTLLSKLRRPSNRSCSIGCKQASGDRSRAACIRPKNRLQPTLDRIHCRTG
jgi:hypothetical protein